MNAVMRGIGYIPKDKKNTQQNYSFRGIDDIYNACHRSLCENGVFIAPTVLSVEKEERTTKSGGSLFFTTLKVSFKFYAPDGSFVETITIGEAMDSADNAANKAQSAAYIYAVMQIFSIPTKDLLDADQTTPEDTRSKSSIQADIEKMKQLEDTIAAYQERDAKAKRDKEAAELWAKFERNPTEDNVKAISEEVAKIFPERVKGFTEKANAHIAKLATKPSENVPNN